LALPPPPREKALTSASLMGVNGDFWRVQAATVAADAFLPTASVLNYRLIEGGHGENDDIVISAVSPRQS